MKLKFNTKGDNRMSAFNYMVFTGGSLDEFVAHAKKYTPEQTVELMKSEMSYMSFGHELSDYRKPTIGDIEERWCRYYVKIPDWCGYDEEGGCYTYCSKGERGGFPVYVIKMESLTES